jgi:CarD family transcriptional regulator
VEPACRRARIEVFWPGFRLVSSHLAMETDVIQCEPQSTPGKVWGIMQFAINDKVVHPRYGAGRITDIQQRGSTGEASSYFVIYIPAQRLTVHVPTQQMEQIGVRPAISLAKVPWLLDTLKSAPDCLQDDVDERQKGLWAKLGTGYVVQAAEVVRDLTWRGYRSHLTKKDTEYLARGREWLAAEMALASDGEISEANKAIDAALAAGMESAAKRG